MRLACLVRLGHSLRQLPTRHSVHSRLLLSRTTCREYYRATKRKAGLPLQNSPPQNSKQRVWNKNGLKSAGFPPSTGRKQHEPHRHRHPDVHLEPRRGSPLGKPKLSPFNALLAKSERVASSSRELLPVPPRLRKQGFQKKQIDQRVEFIKAYDNLEADSEQLAKVMRGFAKNEGHQRRRLAGESPTEADLSKFDEWKKALKDFRLELKPAHDTKGTIFKDLSLLEATMIHFVQQCTTVEEAKFLWPKVPEKVQNVQRRASSLLLTIAVRYVPEKLHLIFEAALLSRFTTPPWYIIEDVVEILAARLRAIDTEGPRAAAAYSLADMVVQTFINEEDEDCIQPSQDGVQSSREQVQFSQLTIYSILNELSDADVGPWYKELCARGCPLHPYTELKFASRLAKSPDTKSSSAHVLQRLHAMNLLDINSPIAASVVTVMLTFSKEQLSKLNEFSTTPADLFRDVHSIGLIPNVITYSTIIRGLCLRGDIGTALDVYDVMQHHGVQPNAWTYSILLHGCRLQASWETFSEIAHKGINDQTRDPVFWNEILYAIYLCVLQTKKAETGPVRNALYAMNVVWARVFNAQSIRPFITGRLTEMGEFSLSQRWFPEQLQSLLKIPSLHPQELIEPDSDSIAIMLLGLIRALPLPYDVIVFYSQYRNMLKTGHPIARLMVEGQGTFVHDLVLRNLLKWPSTLRVALDIIKDMMNDNKIPLDHDDEAAPNQQASGNERPEAQSSIEEPIAATDPPAVDRQAPADEQTQSEQQTSTSESAPERVLHPAPSVHTWTILVHGFMKAKQPADAEYLITLMRERGVEPNVVTWNTLAAGYARMQNIPQAVGAMRRLEAAGHQADDWTIQAFQAIGDKARAVQLMEATVEANKAHAMAAEQQQREEEERERAAEAEKEQVDVDAAEEATAKPTEVDKLLASWPHATEQAYQSEEEAYLDKLIRKRLDNTKMSPLLHLRPKVLSKKKSNAINRWLVNRLQASAKPVNEPHRMDLAAWGEARTRGLKGVPTMPPRRTEQDESLGVVQSDLRKRLFELAPNAILSDNDLDRLGVRVKPKRMPRPRSLEIRPTYLVTPLEKGRFKS